MIGNFLINKERNKITWNCNNKSFGWEVSGLGQAMVDGENQKIYVLSECSPLPKKLDIISEDGNNIFSFSAPENADFYYLTKSLVHPVLIVCVFEKKINGWHDWYYYIDFNKKVLVKESPAY